MEKIIAALFLCCVGFINGGKAPDYSARIVPRFAPIEDVSADIEMAVVAEQIALNAICNLIEKNQKDIKSLADKIDSLRVHRHVEPSFTGSVSLVEGNDFPENGADGSRIKKLRVAFERPYSSPPKVHISLQKIEVPQASYYSLDLRVEDVTKEDFTLRAATRGNDTVVDLAVVSWLSLPSNF